MSPPSNSNDESEHCLERLDKRKHRPQFEQNWRKRFQSFANYDDDAAIAGWSQSGLQTRLRHFQHLWRSPNSSELWLDVGCGAGTYSRLLASHGHIVIGVDYSYQTLAKARQRASYNSLWGVGDVTSLPIKSASCDGVLCFGVMQALADTAPALQELQRVVKPGGEVWVDALNGWCLPHLWEQLLRKMRNLPPHLRYESAGNMKRLMQAAGYEAIQIHWVPILPQRWQRYQWVMETNIIRKLLAIIRPLGALLSHAFIIKGRRQASGHIKRRSQCVYSVI